jgi:hypothetical protein
MDGVQKSKICSDSLDQAVSTMFSIEGRVLGDIWPYKYVCTIGRYTGNGNILGISTLTGCSQRPVTILGQTHRLLLTFDRKKGF